jgi:hypothetical protein
MKSRWDGSCGIGRDSKQAAKLTIRSVNTSCLPRAGIGLRLDEAARQLWRFLRLRTKSWRWHVAVAWDEQRSGDGTQAFYADVMKRIAVWVFYGIGALAIGYLALYAYAAVTGRDLQPGDPIHIFRKPDAPNYSGATDGAFA